MGPGPRPHLNKGPGPLGPLKKDPGTQNYSKFGPKIGPGALAPNFPANVPEARGFIFSLSGIYFGPQTINSAHIPFFPIFGPGPWAPGLLLALLWPYWPYCGPIVALLPLLWPY